MEVTVHDGFDDRMRDHWWWRPGWSVGVRQYTWHVTFEDGAALHRTAGTIAASLARFPALDPVPLRWLHLTVDGVGFEHEVSRRQLDEIAERVATGVNRVVWPPLRFTSLSVGAEGVSLGDNAGRLDGLASVRSILSDASDQVLRGGVPAVGRADTFWPHVSLAYSHGGESQGAVADALRQVDVGTHVEAGAARLTLMKLHRDLRCYEWEVIHQIPIGT